MGESVWHAGWALFLAGCAVGVRDLEGDAGERFYQHPLLSSPEAQVAQGEDRRAWLAEVEVFEGEEAREEGAVVHRSGVRHPPRERVVVPLRPTVAPRQGPVVSAAVRALLAGREQEVEVWLRLRRDAWSPGDDVNVARELAMLGGELSSPADEEVVRALAIARREQAGAAALASLGESIAREGGQVLGSTPRSGQLLVRLPLAVLESLTHRPELAGIDLDGGRPVPEGFHAPSEGDGCVVTEGAGCWQEVRGDRIDGYELEDLIQSGSFYEEGYEGDETIGLVEPAAGTIFTAHPGFLGADGASRWENCAYGVWGCLASDPDEGDGHATGVASILVGDTTRGQDPELEPGEGERGWRSRSGVARGARGFSVGTTDVDFTTRRLSQPERGIHLVNNSWGMTDVWGAPRDPECTGTTRWDREYNELFEEGLAMIKSAGNDGHDDPSDCRVSNPGAALGTFVVGAYQVREGDDGLSRESLALYSARGGTEEEGGGRTIVDLIAPTDHQYPFVHFDRPVDEAGEGYLYGRYREELASSDPYALGGTSGATPVVTGFAAVFRQWYRAVRSDLIDDPGILYANLLLMGDRADALDGRLEVGFDSLTGAGRLRGRRFDELGLDGPYAWGTGRVCVRAGEGVAIPLTQGLDPDIDTLKVVTWWYDHRHDEGVPHDKLTLRVQEQRDERWWTVSADDSDDSKQRVFIQRPHPGSDWRLQLVGRDVTSDHEGCGPDAARVYYAFLLEDQDREAGEALQRVRREGE
ncbi:MAG: S8 family serine peptidase [Deltaproteobacteria bacterium]|nr:S8 family serine peptidase [Deltaproteobacteria bacterium]